MAAPDPIVSPPLLIRLFGPFAVHMNGRPLPRLRSRRGHPLLALLVLRDGAEVERAWLAGLLWPDRPTSQGLSTLRRDLTDLRQALGPEAGRLHSPTHHSLCLELSGAAVDAAAFDALIAQGDFSSLEQAVALYRGPLLEGWTEEWVFQERQPREQAYLAALEMLAERAMAGGDTAAAESYLRRAVAADPLRESAQRALMQALAAGGNYAAAVLAYRDLRLRLHREINTEPDPATAALFHQLRAEARRRLRSGAVGEMSRVVLLHQRHAQPDERRLNVLEIQLSTRGHPVFADHQPAVGLGWARERERQMRGADVIVPLLSAVSVQSEVLAEELKQAHEAAQQHGTPRLLPVWIQDAGPLPEPLASILDPREGMAWAGPQDDERTAGELLAALSQPAPAGIRMPPPPIAHHPRPGLEPVGGAVPLGSPFYVVRSTDEEFHAALARQDGIILLKGARQMGKTSLLARGLDQARKAGAQVVLTDFQKLNAASFDSAGSLLLALAQWAAVQLDLEIMPQEIWNDRCNPNLNFELYLRRQMLRRSPAPVVWGLDEVDRLFPCGCGGEVFGLFRSWHNERILDPASPWNRFTLVISYATEAHLFITDLNQSPFNVGTRVRLNDFTLDQVADLNCRYRSPLRNDTEIARFFRLVGGQPYLVRRGLHEMTTQGFDIAALESQAAQDHGIFSDHLRRVLASLARDPEQCEAVRRVLRGAPCPTADSFYRLHSAGVLAGESAREARPRCQLYAAFLAQHLL